MNLLRVVGSLDPAEGGLSQAIRSSVYDLQKLGVVTEVVCCDSPEVDWLGMDSFPVHALGPRKYGFAYTPKLGSWLGKNLGRFNAVIIDGLWLWPSVCATRAVARERARRKAKGKRQEAKGERQETGGGGLSAEGLANSSHVTRHPSLFVMPHGMLDPWFQRDKSRRVKAVRNWFYWWLLERGVVNSADGLLFTCRHELELARTTFGGYRPKSEIVVGLGIAEPPAFEPEMREAFAAKCPGLNGRPYLLFMSRIHAKKNVAALVRAYARVRSEQNKGVLSHGLTRIDTDGSERLAADRTEKNASCRVTPAVASESRQTDKDYYAFPDLVVAGPGWESDYGREVRGLIDAANSNFAQSSSNLDLKLKTSHPAPIHAVGMLSGAEKWGALYGCEAFVLPSHQENFGIAVVEALACGKPVLISDQVNIWREIVEDGAGLVEGDTEEGVEKLLRRFFDAQRAEAGGLRPEVGGQSSDFSHGLGKMDEDGSERPAADRTGGNAEHRVTSVRGGESSETSDGGPRECYLKRFAIGPAAGRLKGAVMGDL